MSIENPIQTIKKAITASAEKLASNESINKPEPRHFEQIFNMYKQLRESDPVTLEKIIIISVKGKELKDKLGHDLDSVFQQVANETQNRLKEKIISEINIFQNSDELNSSDQNQKLKEIIEHGLNQLKNEILNDSRIKTAFGGHQELLNQCIDFTVSSSKEIFGI